ncbi:MAG: AsmA family protein [Methyloceanibacter sp.]|nr:AsmA family protein [Methyloceanibacter sp.]
MRLIFSILTAVVVLIAGLIFVAPMFISADDVRSELFARVEQMTGYRLRVSGPLDITVFPSLALVAEDVGIAEPTASGGNEFATAKKVRFDLLWTGLLQGNVRVREVTLVNPIVAVPQSRGAAAPPPNAQLAPPADQPLGDPAGAPAAAPASQGSGSGMAEFAEQLKSISLDKLIITNGTVTLPSSDGKPGTKVEKLNLTASLPGYDEPLDLDTDVVVDGRAVRLGAAIGSFGPFLGGATVPVRIKASMPGTLDDPVSLSGSASYKNDTLTLPQFSAKSGDKTLSGSALYKDGAATLSQLTGTVGRDTFAGTVQYKDNIVTVNPLRANVRGTVLAGQVQASLANKVPYVVAAFGAKTIDINAMTGIKKSSPKKSASAKPSGQNKKQGGGNRTRGANRGSGWSNDRIDFSVLRSVNGKVNLRAEQLVYDQVKIAPVSLQVTLEGGKLNAQLAQFGLYGGAGNATVAVDASGKVPTQRVNASLQNFDGRSFLRDAAGLDSIEGKGTVSLNVGAAGQSQRAMVGSLGGQANIEFKNGAIRGVNIAKMIRNLGQGAVSGWQGGAAEKTDFASLGANFQINKGVAQTNDLHLLGPLVTVNGGGTVNLPQQSLNLRVDPQLVASLEGQGRAQELAGLGVPVMIVGPWGSPKIYPDIKGILENPAEAIARYKQFGKDLKNLPGGLGGAAGALDGVVKDGKIDQEKLIQGIGGLLSGNNAAQQPDTAAAPGQAPAAPAPEQEPLANVIKDGKVDQDALIRGIGGLLGGNNAAQQPSAAAPAAPAAPAKPAESQAQSTPQNQVPANDNTQPKQKKLRAEDVGRQLLNNWLSRQ